MGGRAEAGRLVRKGHCHRRQDGQGQPRRIPRQSCHPPRPRLERGERHLPGTAQDTGQEQRDYGHTGTAGDAVYRRLDNNHRRDGDADSHSREDSRRRCGLHTGPQRQPGHPAAGHGTDGKRGTACVGVGGGGQGTRTCGDPKLQSLQADGVDPSKPWMERTAVHSEDNCREVERHLKRGDN